MEGNKMCRGQIMEYSLNAVAAAGNILNILHENDTNS